jgi:hypothetical protein
MEVKEAVALAKQYVYDVFSGETISNIGLEELEFDDDKDIWSITLGFLDRGKLKAFKMHLWGSPLRNETIR